MNEFQLDETALLAPRRRKRSPLRPVWTLLLYATSILPAIWVAWHYDFVRRLDERLKGEPPAAPQRIVETRIIERSVPAVRDNLAVEDTPPNIAPKPLASQSQEMSRVQSPSSPPELIPEVPPSEPVAAKKRFSPPAPINLQVIRLDMKQRRQRAPILGNREALQFQVVSVGDSSYSTQPSDGKFDEETPVTIAIRGDREVRLKVSIDSQSKLRPAFVIEPEVTNDANEVVAFTLQTIAPIRRRLANTGRKTQSALADLENEKSQLETWTKSVGPKPLYEKKRALARIDELKVAIPLGQKEVAALAAEFKAVDKLLDLAKSLDGAELKVGEANPNPDAGQTIFE